MDIQRYNRNLSQSHHKKKFRNMEVKNTSDKYPKYIESNSHSVPPLVGIIMGSDSDLPIMKECATLLEEFGVEFELKIVSAHRTPNEMFQYADTASKRGLKVVICGAGGAAHLPGMVAAITLLPVIGVPICGSKNLLSGVDSLYSIVQMPPGVPVATVSINGAKNAGILACSILSISNPDLLDKIQKYKDKMRDEVKLKNNKLTKAGYKNYLDGQ